MVVHVVPIIRLRRATTWWSYRVPRNLTCVTGSLVVIPFRGHPQLGIVWEVVDTDETATESIERVITPNPLLLSQHRRYIEWLSEAGLVSLSTALSFWMPTSLRKFPLTPTTVSLLSEHTTWKPQASYLAEHTQQLALTPSQRPASTVALVKKYGETVEELFYAKNPHKELRSWLNILHGTVRVILGRERGICAPFLNLRHVLVNEPEDIAYYHEQSPYISLCEAAKQLGEVWHAQTTVRSHIPQEAASMLWGEATMGSIPQAPVTIVDIRREAVLNDLLIPALKNIGPGQTALLLYNAHDRMVATDDEALPEKLLPGIETLRKQLARLLEVHELPATIIVDTRAMFNRPYTQVALTAILAIDPLLTATNFADTVHGWGDIGRLLAYKAPLIIQTKQAGHPLVESLRNSHFPLYCVTEIKERQLHHVPPFTETIACSIPESDQASDEATTVYDRLEKLRLSSKTTWQLSQPFISRRRKQPNRTILLFTPTPERLPRPITQYLTALPRPWKIQRNPWFIV